LLATFPADAQIPMGFKVIGKVTEQSQDAVLLNGKKLEPKGWDSISS
jgi:hypothetical protein